MATALNDRIWKKIFEYLHTGDCILVLGPGLVANKGKTLSYGFAETLINDLNAEKIGYDPAAKNDLAYIGMRWLNLKDTQSFELKRKLSKYYSQNMGEVPDVYKKLATLPFSLVINTSPDDYMYRAFNETGKKAQHSYINFQGKDQQPAVDYKPSIQTPLVYNVFGDIKDTKSLVITKQDQLNFIHNLLAGRAGINDKVQSELNDENNIYLFLGFDAHDWHLPLLFYSFNFHQTDNSIYLQSPMMNSKAIQDFYEDSFKFKFINEHASAFVDDFDQRYTDWLEEEGETRSVVSAGIAPGTYLDRPKPVATVLVLTSNPRDTQLINLNKEIKRSIKEVHQSSVNKEDFEVIVELDSETADLLRCLVQNNPQIIHFSGHGEQDGLLFMSQAGYSHKVAGESLAKLIGEFRSTVSCVVLNACYSEAQAALIAQYIPNVIGMSYAIADDNALLFSKSFYTAIFNGQPYKKAFDIAVNFVGLYKFQGDGAPVFFQQGVKVV